MKTYLYGAIFTLGVIFAHPDWRFTSRTAIDNVTAVAIWPAILGVFITCEYKETCNATN